MQDASTGYYMAAGGGWGTQACLMTRPQKFDVTLSDGTYTLSSFASGSSGNYLGTNGYTDSSVAYWTIAETTTEGQYTIYNSTAGGYLTAGETAGDALTFSETATTEWKFVSITEGIDQAALDNPVDVTGLISNPDFKRNATSYWTVTSYDGSESAGNFTFSASSTYTNFIVESWRSTNGFKIQQTLTDLPAGLYGLSGQGFAHNYNDYTDPQGEIFAGDSYAKMPPLSNTALGYLPTVYSNMVADATWQATDVVYVSVEEGGSLTIGLRNEHTASWTTFAHTKLVYLGSTATVKDAMASEITAASTAAAEVTGLTVADETTQTTLTAALSALEALDASATYNEILSAITAVEEAIAAVELSHASASAAIEDGNYLIQNVETGYYLGGGNTWGTQASTLGKPQWLGLELQSDGTYHLDSHQSNGGSNHYLNVGGYLDTASPSAITITKVEDGIYTLYVADGGYITSTGKNAVVNMSGTDATVEAAQWKLITMADVLEEQAEATVDAPVDVTALIYNPEMKRNYTLEVDGLGSWTTTAYSSTDSPANFNWGDPNGATANVAESWHSSNGFKVVQTLPTLAVGVYSLDAHALYRQDGTDEDNLPIMFFSDETTTLPKITDDDNDSSSDSYTNSMALAYSSFLNGNYPTETLYLEVTEENKSSVTIGFQNANTAMWNIFGELTLKYYGTEANVAKVAGTIAAGAYATRIFPFTPDLPDGISVYSCSTLEDDGETLSLETVETPAANTPYILYNSTEEEIDITTKTAFVEDAASTTAGLLTGVLSETDATTGTYVLQTQGDTQGFYLVDGSVSITIPAYRAYLTVDGSEARAFTFGNGSATAINAIEALTSGNAEIYDLNGRKLSKLQKGVNIVNGKKVILK